jgi:hypothetical protein
MGRLAQAYGLKKVAESYYKQVRRPKQLGTETFYAHTQKRLTVLSAESEATQTRPDDENP